MTTRAFAFANLIGGDNKISLESLPTEATEKSTTSFPSTAALPLSGNNVGDQAFVQSTNRLYIWNGSGWYNVALINTNPSFDSGGGPEASYILDSSGGTPIVIQLSANDPEDLPIQWSYVASDSAQYFATIQQDSSVFTITALPTPTIQQYDSDGGTFSITFKASDGVNLATALSEFTFTFIKNFGIIDNTINSYQSSATLAHSSGVVRAGTISSDGTKLYTTTYSTGTTRQWNLSTPYDLTSATYINQKSSILASVWNIQLKPDGSVLYMSANNGQLKSFSFGTPYDITTLNSNPTATITMPSTTSNRYGTFCFTPAGDRLIIASYDSGRLYQYTLASPYVITNMTLDGTWNSPFTPVSPRFNATGEKLFVNNISPIKIYEYNLATPFDIVSNPPVAEGNTFDLRPIDTSQSTFSVEYDPSGDQFFVWGYSTGLVYSVDNTDWPNYQ